MIITTSTVIRRLLLSRVFKTFALVLCVLPAAAQHLYPAKVLPRFIDRHLQEIRIDSLPANALFIIATNKSCEKCFSDECVFKDKAPIYLLLFEPVRLSAIPAMTAHYRAVMPCATDIFFLKDASATTDSTQRLFMETVRMNPSPQLFIRQVTFLKYFPYKDLSKFAL